jgi:hypothetical protein
MTGSAPSLAATWLYHIGLVAAPQYAYSAAAERLRRAKV